MDISEQLVVNQLAQQEQESDRRRAIVALTGATVGLGGIAVIADQISHKTDVFADYVCNWYDEGAYFAERVPIGTDESGNTIYKDIYKCPDSNTSVKPTPTTAKPVPTTAKPTPTTAKPVTTQPKPTNPPVVVTPAPTLPPTTATTTTVEITTTTEKPTTTTVEKTTTTKESTTTSVAKTEAPLEGTSTTSTVAVAPKEGSGFMDQHGTEALAVGGALVAVSLVVAGLRYRGRKNAVAA